METYHQNQKVGAFVTNKWLVGALMVLLMGMGSYIFQGIGKGTEAQANQISELQRKTQILEVDLASQKVALLIQHNEVIRRLDRIEAALYGVSKTR